MSHRRLGMAAIVCCFFTVGYFGVGWATIPAAARSMATPLDERIPFVAPTVWFYLWSYSAALIPLFFVSCSKLFRMTCVAYCAAIATCLICFLAFPVTSAHLRVNPAKLSPANFSEWAVLVIYALDPPYNLFPSLHVSLTTIAAISGWKANKRYGIVFLICLGLVIVSVCTIKQHFALDALAGLMVGAIIARVTLPISTTSQPMNELWPGPRGYVVLLILFYSSFYLGFLLYRANNGKGFPTLVPPYATQPTDTQPMRR